MPTGPVHAALLLCCHQTKVQWSQVVLDGSKPKLSGPANPPSPVSRRSHWALMAASIISRSTESLTCHGDIQCLILGTGRHIRQFCVSGWSYFWIHHWNYRIQKTAVPVTGLQMVLFKILRKATNSMYNDSNGNKTKHLINTHEISMNISTFYQLRLALSLNLP